MSAGELTENWPMLIRSCIVVRAESRVGVSGGSVSTLSKMSTSITTFVEIMTLNWQRNIKCIYVALYMYKDMDIATYIVQYAPRTN